MSTDIRRMEKKMCFSLYLMFYLGLKSPNLSSTWEGGKDNAPSCSPMCPSNHKRFFYYQTNVPLSYNKFMARHTPSTHYYDNHSLFYLPGHTTHSPSNSNPFKTTLLMVSKISIFKKPLGLGGNQEDHQEVDNLQNLISTNLF